MSYRIIEASNPYLFAPSWSKAPSFVDLFFGNSTFDTASLNTVRTYGSGGDKAGTRQRRSWSAAKTRVWEAAKRNCPATVQGIARAAGIGAGSISYFMLDFVNLGLLNRDNPARSVYTLTKKGEGFISE